MLKFDHFHIGLGDFALLFDLLDHLHHSLHVTLGTANDDRAQLGNELDLRVADHTGTPCALATFVTLERQVGSRRDHLTAGIALRLLKDGISKRRMLANGCRGNFTPYFVLQFLQQSQRSLDRRGLGVLQSEQLQHFVTAARDLVQCRDQLLPTGGSRTGCNHRDRVVTAIDLHRRALHRHHGQLKGGAFTVATGCDR